MKWIKKHKLIVILICAIVILFAIMCVSLAKSGNTSPLGRGAQKVVSVVEKPISAVTGGIKKGVGGIVHFKATVNENAKLKKQVSQLEQEKIDLTLGQEELKQLKELSKALDYDEIKSGEKELTSANVIAVDYSNWMNVFTIDKGKESGIKKGCIVVNGEGLIGKVFETGNGWSKVISVVDSSNKISFKILRNTKLMGVANGDGKGNLEGYMLDGKAGVIEGDILITSGIGIYPEGFKIGKVTSVEYNKDTQYKEIKADAIGEFNSLQKVAVMI